MLRLKDLQEQGFELNKADAMELHTHITHHAQRGSDEHVTVFEPSKKGKKTEENSDLTGDSTQVKKETSAQKKSREKAELQLIENGTHEKRSVTEEDLAADAALLERGIKIGEEAVLPKK